MQNKNIFISIIEHFLLRLLLIDNYDLIIEKMGITSAVIVYNCKTNRNLHIL